MSRKAPPATRPSNSITKSSAPRRRGTGNSSSATTDRMSAIAMVTMLMRLGSVGSLPVAATHRLLRMATSAAMVSNHHGRLAAPVVIRARRKPLATPTRPAKSSPTAVTLSRTESGTTGSSRTVKTQKTTASPTAARRKRRWARAGALNAMAERYRRAGPQPRSPAAWSRTSFG